MLKSAFSGHQLDPLLENGEAIGPCAATNREEALGEARVRLLQGIKRYFHGKRAEGLISSKVGVGPSCMCSALERLWARQARATWRFLV